MKEDIIGYIRKTGHQYFGKQMEVYECTDNCGTCDGVRCDYCKDQYVVADFANNKEIYKGYDKQKAIDAAGYDFTK